MKVCSPGHSGFCPGVQQAERKIAELRQSRPDQQLFILGPLIHNTIYIKHLTSLDIRTIERAEEAPKGSLLIVRTHGIPSGLQASLAGDYELVNLTCPKVRQVQSLIASHADKGGFIVLTGSKTHPEVQGLVSYAHHHLVIENEAGLAGFSASLAADPGYFRARGCASVLVVSQTTGEEALFRETAEKMKTFCAEHDYECVLHDSICSITSLRESEAILLQKECQVTFVVGDPLSSNARKLHQTLRSRNPATWFIESAADLEKIDLGGWTSAQVVSSSSTPDSTEQAVIDYLKNR